MLQKAVCFCALICMVGGHVCLFFEGDNIVAVESVSCWLFEIELPATSDDYNRLVVSEMVAPESCRVATCALEGAIGPNCTDCIPGYSMLEPGGCVACPVDFFNPRYDDSACEPCETGMSTLGLVGQTACWGCFERCTVCPDGFVLRADTCKQCDPGTQAGGNETCEGCTPGFYSATGRRCQSCPANTYAPFSYSTECFPCMANSQSLGGGASQCTCVPGTAFDYLSERCSPCLAGHYSTGSVCLPCPVGTACNQTGCAECVECAADAFADGVGSLVCKPCPGVRSQVDACLCPAGTYGESTAVTDLIAQCRACATECPAQHFVERACDSLNDLRCTACSSECPFGFYVTKECELTANIVCKRCSVRCLSGFYIAKDCERSRDMICSKCSESCAPGFLLHRPCSGASDIVCDPCPAGTYATDDGCQRCPDGFYQPASGSTHCLACHLLTDANQTQCYLCPSGHYRATRFACAACPPMTYGANGGCKSCVGGNFRSVGATACVNPPIS